MMANKLPLMFLLAIALSPARGYICNSNTSLPRDDFENHGCFCDTETVANHSNESRHLFFTYEKAFAGCHETEGDVTIECAFLESEAPILKRLFNRTSLSEIPVIDKDGVYEDVTCLLLSGNSISSITHQQMRQFPKLKAIYLNYNLGIKIDPDAFDSNPDLINISLANNGLTEYPNLTSAENLTFVNLSKNALGPNIPGYLIDKLTIIDLERAELTGFPNITGATKLEKLMLAHNHITNIPNISSLTALQILDLQHNQIENLEPDNFTGLVNVTKILLNNNKIKVLENYVFQDMKRLHTLELQHNLIHHIKERAFHGTEKIRYLVLNGNKFSKLPTSDLQNLITLNVTGVRSLIDFPRAFDENNNPTFPSIQNLRLEYATHCCWYKDYYLHATQKIFIDLRRRRRHSPNITYYPTNKLVSCDPQPDAFHPCYDIIQFTYLRVAIWFIITAAVCGNVLVMIVLIFSMIKKTVTVPQILITNLAAADFYLAIYLIFIAAADLDTAGRYENEAFNWERSAACKTAGFFAVFSSVASICLLALITFERMTTIAFSYTGKRFMTIPKTVVALVIVWSIAFTFGILPAVGVSNYGKVCICLPFEASTSLDKGYIISLLLFTGIVCFFILICYVILFIRVKKTTSSLSGRQELRIAFKMSVLVFTDFLIWAPIAVIGLTGVLRGKSLIGVQESKYLMIFIFPINCWVNPLLYSILQNAFRNQLCDMFAHCGLCKEYHQRRKAKAQGLTTYNAPTNGRKLRISSITSTSTYISFLNLFSKRASVTSIGSNEATQMQNLTRKKHRSHSSTSSDQQSIKEGRFLTPIHESPAHEKQESGTQEANVVFYSDTSHPVNDSSRAQLLSKNSSVVLTEDSSDSGVAQDSDTPLNNSPSNNNTPNDQPIVFNVTFFPDTESTEC